MFVKYVKNDKLQSLCVCVCVNCVFFYKKKKNGVENIFTLKLLVNFTNNEEMATHWVKREISKYKN